MVAEFKRDIMNNIIRTLEYKDFVDRIISKKIQNCTIHLYIIHSRHLKYP